MPIINVHHSPPFESRATKTKISRPKNGKGHLGSYPAHYLMHCGISSTRQEILSPGRFKNSLALPPTENTIHRHYKWCKGAHLGSTASTYFFFFCHVFCGKKNCLNIALYVLASVHVNYSYVRKCYNFNWAAKNYELLELVQPSASLITSWLLNDFIEHN